MAGRKGKDTPGTPAIRFTEHAGDDYPDLSAIVGKALGLQTRPPGSKTQWELRTEFGVSRSVMQKTLRKLMEDGVVTRLKIVERDEQGKAKQNTVYLKVGEL
jgi:predicted HTH transcriptional regulator